jgi:hypothetical protein
LVAYVGIAATLLAGGKISHATFKLSLNLTSTGQLTCNICRGSARAKILQQFRLIVRDESTTSVKAVMETSDCTLQCVKVNNVTGRRMVVLAEDLQHNVPVIPLGTKAEEVQLALSHLIYMD